MTYFQNDEDKPILHLVLNKGDKIVAIIEAVKNTNKNILLPNNNQYFMMYRDLSLFDLDKMTGKIKLIDLNYDSETFNELEYKNGRNVKADLSPIPVSVLNKYSKLAAKNQNYLLSKNNTQEAVNGTSSSDSKTLSINDRTILKTKVPCDGNGNGNLSFAECYSCMNGACQTNSDCYTLCYGIGDVIGWLATGAPYCQASIGAACVYLAIQY